MARARLTAVVVFITASSADEAARIGRALVEERLAACANLIPSI
ncbi:MAG: divalent cation tolerance protein CutA, partial [bacterium]